VKGRVNDKSGRLKKQTSKKGKKRPTGGWTRGIAVVLMEKTGVGGGDWGNLGFGSVHLVGGGTTHIVHSRQTNDSKKRHMGEP